jgi:hypothetical protein
MHFTLCFVPAKGAGTKHNQFYDVPTGLDCTGHCEWKSSFAPATYATLYNAVVRSEFTAHSIFKYRRPPNIEEVRDMIARRKRVLVSSTDGHA